MIKSEVENAKSPKVFNVALIKDFLKNKNLTKTELSQQAKISFGTLNKILNNNANVGICSVFRLSRYMNVHLCEMFLTY